MSDPTVNSSADPKKTARTKHIVLTSHPSQFGPKPLPIRWGEQEPLTRGPVIGSLTNPAHRNVVGTHSGAYALYRALAVASGSLQASHRADLTNTAPTVNIGPHDKENWKNDPYF